MMRRRGRRRKRKQHKKVDAEPLVLKDENMHMCTISARRAIYINIM